MKARYLNSGRTGTIFLRQEREDSVEPALPPVPCNERISFTIFLADLSLKCSRYYVYRVVASPSSSSRCTRRMSPVLHAMCMGLTPRSFAKFAPTPRTSSRSRIFRLRSRLHSGTDIHRSTSTRGQRASEISTWTSCFT